MTVLLIALTWLAVATMVALGLGRGIRLADTRQAPDGRDLHRELDSVLAGLEDDLRAAAGPTTV
ncbi:hypothetical protein [Geodermatophilus normandii]|uniref:Uncharacterized protein n=1 Tax=Geodermatophilus normandii TaxID=1137989 RepID=A0A6P0GFA3_9ACTN|nr:hypothetical protein [Geodermatophilus normandii]NEM05953.1 hypothetical protein [Geodermatophilus normandii]